MFYRGFTWEGTGGKGKKKKWRQTRIFHVWNNTTTDLSLKFMDILFIESLVSPQYDQRWSMIASASFYLSASSQCWEHNKSITAQLYGGSFKHIVVIIIKYSCHCIIRPSHLCIYQNWELIYIIIPTECLIARLSIFWGFTIGSTRVSSGGKISQPNLGRFISISWSSFPDTFNHTGLNGICKKFAQTPEERGGLGPLEASRFLELTPVSLVSLVSVTKTSCSKTDQAERACSKSDLCWQNHDHDICRVAI